MGIEIWLIIWFFTHAIYRMAVGTVCTVTGKEPPWVSNHKERLTRQETAKAKRYEAMRSKRTLRGFFGRLWGDLWEDSNAWLDGAREEKAKRLKEHPEGKPVVSVDADQAADWARDLGDKVKSWWNKWNSWWAPSRKQCPWLTPVLNADHTHVEGRACGGRVRGRDTYCPPHEAFAEIGHCLRFNGDATNPQCMSPRHRHYPYCLPHLEEWGNNAADREVAAPSTPEAAKVGTLETPDAPGLAATSGMTDEQRQLAAKIKDAWLRGELVEPDPSNAEWFALPVSVRADLLKAAEDGGIRIDTTFDPDARTHAGLPIGWRKTDQPAARPATDSTMAGPSLPQPVKSQPGGPLCQWGRGTTNESPDHGQPPCTDQAGAGGIHCSPHQIEYGRWEAGVAEPQPPEQAVTPAAEADASEPAPEPDTPVQPETTTEPEPEIPPQRPALRLVPGQPDPDDFDVREEVAEGLVSVDEELDRLGLSPSQREQQSPNTQGDTDTMTAPSEITNVQSLKNFAEKVKAHGSQEWPSMLENAEAQIGAAGLSNDPAITSEIGAMREAAGMFAAAGDRLEVALRPHENAAEQISGLGNRAADKTATYQNQ